MNSNTIAIIDCASIVERKLEKALSEQGLSVAQLRILELADQHKGQITPTQLAAILLQETHSVSGLLNRLEDRDLITRTRDRQDRRVVWVGLTKEGRALLDSTTSEIASVERTLVHFGFGEAFRVMRDQLLFAFVPERTLELRAEMAALASHNDAAARTPVAAGR